MKRYLKFNFKIEEYETIPSTNALAKEKAKQGANEGLLIISQAQTAGKGRFDRKFHSPQNSGIYMSLVLRPEFSGFNATLITTAAAVAVARAVENLSGKRAKIKWVNDVLVNGKKVCGILTEGAVNPKTLTPEYVILGIGINAFTPKNGFAEDIKAIAGSVFEGNAPNLKEKLTADVLNIFWDFYLKLENKEFLEEYRQRSCVLGKKITVIRDDSQIPATAIAIDNDCRLEVELENGQREFLSSGEISIKI